MTAPGFDIAPTALALSATAAAIGAVAGGVLVKRGLAQLDRSASSPAKTVGRVTGAVAGISAVFAARLAGRPWLLPALLVWAYGLVAAATCDALTQRVPTPLVRQGIAATAVLVLAAAAVTGHWRWAGLAAICAASATATFAICWRFLGAGFGDVRLAALGGIGLAHPTHTGLAAAIAAFIVITVSQAVAALIRGGNRHTTFPYGPAIAVAFLVAATA